MDEYTPDTLVKRDEPVPVMDIKKPRRQRSGSPDSAHSRSSSQSKSSIQDRLFSKYYIHSSKPSFLKIFWVSNGGNLRLLQQVIPADDEDGTDSGDKAFMASPKRPPFSLPTMSNNFRRFNAR